MILFYLSKEYFSFEATEIVKILYGVNEYKISLNMKHGFSVNLEKGSEYEYHKYRIG